MGDADQDDRKPTGRRTGIDRRVYRDMVYKGPERRRLIDRRGTADKRRYKRFRVRDLTFVKMWSESEEDIGQLMDISQGGLSLRYFVDADKQADYSQLGIFLSGEDFTIDKIPFRTVSNVLLANKSPLSPVILRRHGIRFDDLTPKQKHKLDYFLSNYTLGEA